MAQALQTEAPDPWKACSVGVWRRKSKQPEVAVLYDSNLRIAAQSLQRWLAAHSKLRERVPVVVDARLI